jgi:hypothetical protein
MKWRVTKTPHHHPRQTQETVMPFQNYNDLQLQRIRNLASSAMIDIRRRIAVADKLYPTPRRDISALSLELQMLRDIYDHTVRLIQGTEPVDVHCVVEIPTDGDGVTRLYCYGPFDTDTGAAAWMEAGVFATPGSIYLVRQLDDPGDPDVAANEAKKAAPATPDDDACPDCGRTEGYTKGCPGCDEAFADAMADADDQLGDRSA